MNLETAATAILALSALNGAATKKLDPAFCAFDRGGFTLNSGNVYFPLGVGSPWMLEGDEDGASIEVLITVLDQTAGVGGASRRAWSRSGSGKTASRSRSHGT